MDAIKDQSGAHLRLTHSKGISKDDRTVDCIYVAASALDFRYTRICIASIRYFYPSFPVKVLAGGSLQRSLVKELRRYWDVTVENLPEGDYGWGFVKLEPLFFPPGHRFLILDSDTVLTGPVLKHSTERDEEFIVDLEDQTAEGMRSIYFDVIQAAKSGASLEAPAFLFNTGQWFGRSGLLTRDHFTGLVEWEWPRRVSDSDVFKNGDQGVLNYVVNEQCRKGAVRVARVPLMRWPGHGMQGLSVDSLATGSCPTLVVHWAGMKSLWLRDMVGADLLAFFECQYYRRLPFGRIRMVVNVFLHIGAHCRNWIRVRAHLAARRFISADAAKTFKQRST